LISSHKNDERAEKAGVKVVVLTVDLNSGSNRVTLGQYIRADERDCSACHGDGPNAWLESKPMYSGTGVTSAEFDSAGSRNHLRLWVRWVHHQSLILACST